MKKRITRIWGISLILVVLASLLITALPASAGPLFISKEVFVPGTGDNILIPSDYSITDMAVSADGQTVYAVATNATDGAIYKSTNGGAGWAPITLPATTYKASKIAVAPDDANVIVVVDNAVKFYASTNAGSFFSPMNNTAGNITDGTTNLGGVTDIQISPLTGATRYVAVAGVDDVGGADAGVVFYFNMGDVAPVWTNAADTATFTGGPGNETNVFSAIAFSPNFASDLILTAVAQNSTGVISFHVASFNQKQWDANIFTNYPVALATATGTVQAASIAIDPGYLGGDDSTRLAFVGYSTTAAEGDLYRLKDTKTKEMLGGAGTEINSVAWDGTNLVAGAYDENKTYYCSDATVTDPTVIPSRSNKGIGIDVTGTNETVVVAWSGANVFGTQAGTGSAFGVSTDYGRSWNAISLMATTTTKYLDFYSNSDSTKQYLLASDGASMLSLLMYDGTAWQRVFNYTSAEQDWIVRAASADFNALYVANTGSTNTTLFYATDGGMQKWQQRTFRYTAGIQDMAVQSADIAYVAKVGGTTISKTTNGGFIWADEVQTTVSGSSIKTVKLIADDQLLVGSNDGHVAYSTNGNGSWSKINAGASTSGAAQVTATGLNTDDYIFIATDAASSLIERWQIGQGGPDWRDMAAPNTNSSGYYGLDVYQGVLIGLSANATPNSQVVRDIEPENSDPAGTQWTTFAATGKGFNRTPSALRISASSIKAWFIDTAPASNDLYSLSDSLALGTPITLTSPADGFLDTVNSVSGNPQDIAFVWTQPAGGLVAYEVQIIDSADTVLTTATVAATPSPAPSVVIGPSQTSTTAVANGQFLSFSPGQVYYWKVRTTSPAYSPWSAKRSFTIQPLAAAVPALLSPANGTPSASVSPAFSWSPISGTTEYQFQLAQDPTFTAPVVDSKIAAAGILPDIKLVDGTTYFWRVKTTAPVPGDWSAIANFTVAVPVTSAPPVTITQAPAPIITIPAAPPATTITIPPAPPAQQIAPGYIWAIIIIGAVLVIAVIVLIVRTRRAV